jgi:hypothetical protein
VFKMSVNLRGSPAMSPEEFKTNRWSLKAAVSIPVVRSSIKMAYSSGLTTQGGASRAVTVARQMSWLSARWSGR